MKVGMDEVSPLPFSVYTDVRNMGAQVRQREGEREKHQDTLQSGEKNANKQKQSFAPKSGLR